jgi:hypothetical protein
MPPRRIIPVDKSIAIRSAASGVWLPESANPVRLLDRELDVPNVAEFSLEARGCAARPQP